jgi:RNA polymerase sigma-70 factor (ECF subfamily)
VHGPAVLDRVAREEGGRIIATLIRHVGGDFALAEDALQDAYAVAAATWGTGNGAVPDNPGAWLTTAARRRAIDRLRRARALDDRIRVLEALAARDAAADPEDDEEEEMESSLHDDRLRLLFTCCHPALPLEARVALTLKSLGGLTTGEVARAFLVSEVAMHQRLTRARRKIADKGIPYRVPPDELLPERLAGVLAVVYLIFNEGHTAAGGPRLVRDELCAEAVRLGRLLAGLMPDEPEALGLLALMLLTDARRAARVDAQGHAVALADQDRGRWDAEAIGEGAALLDRALRLARPGPYQLQAAIAALHATAPDWAATDWGQIAALYGALAAHDPSPVVTVNRAVAVGFAHGPQAGLDVLRALDGDPALEGYVPLHAARAELLSRAGDRPGADAAYACAIAATGNMVQRAELEARRAAAAAPGRSSP